MDPQKSHQDIFFFCNVWLFLLHWCTVQSSSMFSQNSRLSKSYSETCLTKRSPRVIFQPYQPSDDEPTASNGTLPEATDAVGHQSLEILKQETWKYESKKHGNTKAKNLEIRKLETWNPANMEPGTSGPEPAKTKQHIGVEEKSFKSCRHKMSTGPLQFASVVLKSGQ